MRVGTTVDVRDMVLDSVVVRVNVGEIVKVGERVRVLVIVRSLVNVPDSVWD